MDNREKDFCERAIARGKWVKSEILIPPNRRARLQRRLQQQAGINWESDYAYFLMSYDYDGMFYLPNGRYVNYSHYLHTRYYSRYTNNTSSLHSRASLGARITRILMGPTWVKLRHPSLDSHIKDREHDLATGSIS